MSHDFYIRMLKPVPEQFREDRIFDENEITAAGLERVWNTDLDDQYHVPVKVRSVYAGMDDIKEYLKSVLPGTIIGNWGMKHRRGFHHCYGLDSDWSYDIPEDVMESLKRPHIAECAVILCEKAWSVEDYDAEWLGKKCPMYITKQTLKEAAAAYLEHLYSMESEELSYKITEHDRYTGNIMDSIYAAYAYARKAGGTGYIEWE